MQTKFRVHYTYEYGSDFISNDIYGDDKEEVIKRFAEIKEKRNVVSAYLETVEDLFGRD